MMTNLNYVDEEFHPSMEDYIGGAFAAICGIEINPHIEESPQYASWKDGNYDASIIEIYE
jgi:hypothetical protein